MARIHAKQETSGRTLLLVDDNQEYLEATRAVLARQGHEVLTATDGRQALEQLGRYHVELILLDYSMPGMDGVELVGEIRKLAPHVHIILQTGQAGGSSPGEIVKKLGVQGYVDKSEGPEKLLLWTEIGLKSALTVQALNGQLLKEAEERAARMAMLVETNQALAGNLEFDDLMKTIHREFSRAFGATSLGVATCDHASARWQSTYFINDGVRSPQRYFGLSEGLAGYIIRQRKPLLFKTDSELRQFHDDNGIALIGRSSHSWMGVPLIAGDMVEGSMCIQNFQDDHCYDESDLTLFATLGTQVALAIRNARLYRQAAEARAEAEEANRTKSRFLANVSHELRTPLNAIINFSWILGQELPTLTTDHRNLLQRIEQSGHYLLELINSILDLAKIEAGHMDLSLERINLAAVVAESIRMVEGMLDGSPVTLRVDLPAELPEIQADRARLSQVLLNLLSNSVKFTQQGTITVSAEVTGAFLTIHVADSGMGIEARDIGRIFSEFVQLDPDADRKKRGTGLGLPISARLVQLMGGRMWVNSEKGSGSVFSFTVPISGGPAS
ncbi:MAG: hypothetical protein A2087_01715 [Spirochaetes bacterium GWD1_61_31]|nr:MAG: hypothetical protein A2Y37_10080 [Spirochaetes bacterium GWB1_60_80]OHD35899.1 MAG: hypothetical protein A2087_01715 [Spirochaetes bacterium GWD1_61_31]OHD44235.1 MAG: hypothetical protein A2Y35_06765 [Spirochaetes bacterium GWE1_60_18]OHD60405.1 MAG: hypothetical protein A2Y32_00760 [Spirochaetes bacterium GWF1_60_12]HBO41924.1 hypothetical protein [Spirochaetaceae bacterium]